MSRICRWAFIVGLVASAGCTRSEEYVEVARGQRKAMEEIRSVLADVKDEKSMEAAKAELDRRFDQYEAIARRARALPQPSAEARARLEDEKRPLETALRDMRAEIDRVK